MSDQDHKKTERAARERFERAMVELREGTYRFASKVRGQAGIIVEELIDPDGETVLALADVEGDAGALALAFPLDLITFETWLFGQIGDQEELDIELDAHWQLWFNFGAWIGETLRRRHGGHWLTMSDDPRTWRLGFSKVMLEIAPFGFAEQLLRMGQGGAQKLVGEIERLRMMHAEQKERDKGKEIDRFTAEHYVRMHTIPLGQWLVMDFRQLERLWNHAAARDLVREIKKQARRLGQQNTPVVAQIIEALGKAAQDKPIGQQGGDRALFEAVAQIVASRRAASPVAIDVLENYVLPTMHIGLPDRFPSLTDDDLAELRKGIELYALFIRVTPTKYEAEKDGFLGSIPHEDLSSPYGDRKTLEVNQGDWVVLDTKRFKKMLLDFDSRRLLDKYDHFIKYLRSNPKAPRQRDDGRYLAETVANALVDLKASLVAASKEGHSLLFRMLPPPG
ncbi:MAG: hypothetical protein MJE77_07695 [Proteobacteria bacterium]|nr:hypothetical protein [Pseudomonadota bacterium]